jgi:hypothetical protein
MQVTELRGGFSVSFAEWTLVSHEQHQTLGVHPKATSGHLLALVEGPVDDCACLFSNSTRSPC